MVALGQALDLRDDGADGGCGDYSGQALIEAAVMVGQRFVIKAHKVQNGGVQIPNVVTVDGGFEAEFVGLAVVSASLDAGAGHPVGESFRVVVASTVFTLEHRLASEFTTPDDQGLL